MQIWKATAVSLVSSLLETLIVYFGCSSLCLMTSLSTKQHQVCSSVNQILNIFSMFPISWLDPKRQIWCSEYIFLRRTLKLVCDVTTHDTCRSANTSSAQIVPDSIWLELTMNTHVCRGAVPFLHRLKIPLRLRRRIQHMTSPKNIECFWGKKGQECVGETADTWGWRDLKCRNSPKWRAACQKGKTEGPCMIDNKDVEI